jgi:hypothetical protein
MIGIKLPTRAEIFLFSTSLKTTSGAHTSSNKIGDGLSLPAHKVVGAKPDSPPSFGAWNKNAWMYTSIPRITSSLCA